MYFVWGVYVSIYRYIMSAHDMQGCTKNNYLGQKDTIKKRAKELAQSFFFWPFSYLSVFLIHWWKDFSEMKKINEQEEKIINQEHVSLKYYFKLISTYQSSLLKTMNPLFPLPNATWLLPLSHQFVKGWPSTTLRNITMFL